MTKKISKQPWIILFGGPGREGVLVKLKSIGIKVAAVIVPTVTNDRLVESVGVLSKYGFYIAQTVRDEVDTTLKPWSGYVLLSVGFPYLLSSNVIRRHNVRLNLHPTLLPKYRGPTSGPYILINDEKESGSTVHMLEEQMDAGDIVVQSRVAISKFDTNRSLQRKVYESEPELILRAISHLDNGLPLVKQNECDATSFPVKRTPNDSEIDSRKSLNDLYDLIRACDPDNYPAFFMIEEEKVCIRLWRPEKSSNDFDMI